MDLDLVKTAEYLRWERWRNNAAPTTRSQSAGAALPVRGGFVPAVLSTLRVPPVMGLNPSEPQTGPPPQVFAKQQRAGSRCKWDMGVRGEQLSLHVCHVCVRHKRENFISNPPPPFSVLGLKSGPKWGWEPRGYPQGCPGDATGSLGSSA